MLLAKSRVQKFTKTKFRSCQSCFPPRLQPRLRAVAARGKSAGQQTLPVQSDVTFWFCHLSGAGTEERRRVCQARVKRCLASGGTVLEEVVPLRWIKGLEHLSALLLTLPHPLPALPSHFLLFCCPHWACNWNTSLRVRQALPWSASRSTAGRQTLALVLFMLSFRDWHWRWAWQAFVSHHSSPPVPTYPLFMKLHPGCFCFFFQITHTGRKRQNTTQTRQNKRWEKVYLLTCFLSHAKHWHY